MSKLSERVEYLLDYTRQQNKERKTPFDDPDFLAQQPSSVLCVSQNDLEAILAALRAHETGASGAVPWREMVTLADFESDPHGYETTRYEAIELALKSVPNFADATRAAERMRERAAMVADNMASAASALAAAIRALPTDGE